MGDPEGVAVLKAMLEEHKDYLKFLLGEAQSSSNHAAPFRGADGRKWEIVLHLDSGDIEVRAAADAL